MKKLFCYLLGGIMIGVVVLGITGMATAARYGEGAYGRCQYNDNCSISMTTVETVSLNVTPTDTGVYTIDDDQVDVTTNNPIGYTMTVESDSATENALAGLVDEIPATSGTPAEPTSLTDNQWGFRIDGFADFGEGPTSTVSNQASTSLTFAGVPLNGSAVTIKTTDSAAPNGDSTTVWYGVRADFDVAPDTYSRTVIYTAITL